MAIIPESWLPLTGSTTNPSIKLIYAWGWIVYKDIFPNTPIHVTEFCNHLLATGYTAPDSDNPLPPPVTSNSTITTNWESCKKHNCIDQYCEDYDEVVKLLQ
jgi:hypothetical protein